MPSPSSAAIAQQQLVRYEALFKLLDQMRPLEDFEAVARLCATRWKYFANVSAWRIVLAVDMGFLVLDGISGTGSVRELPELEGWDAFHWQANRPCVLRHDEWPAMAGVPRHLAGEGWCELQVLPILRRDRQVAVLSTAAHREPCNALDKKFIHLFGAQLADHLLHMRLRQQTMIRLRNQATIDALTGALNRGAIMDRLRLQWAIAQRVASPLAVLLADVDLFKCINDSHGHAAGDEVLCEIARRFGRISRVSASFGRYGGEEFLFVLYPCSARDALHAASRIRIGVEEAPFIIDLSTGQEVSVTISLGVAGTDECGAQSPEELISRADEALYQAKANGRNRAMLAQVGNPAKPGTLRHAERAA